MVPLPRPPSLFFFASVFALRGFAVFRTAVQGRADFSVSLQLMPDER
jgi:hypothetical protein